MKLNQIKSLVLENLTIGSGKEKLLSEFEIFVGEGERKNSLNEMAKINFLVGPNNSGKSRFLRGLFEGKNFLFELKGFDSKKYLDILAKVKDEILDTLTKNVGYPKDRYVFTKERMHFFTPFERFCSEGLFERNNPRKLVQIVDELKSDKDQIYRFAHDIANQWGYPSNVNLIRDNVLVVVEAFCIQIQALAEELPSIEDIPSKSVYIPIIRSLRLSDEEDKIRKMLIIDFFHEAELNQNTNMIENGTHIFSILKTMLLTSAKKREEVLQYEKFLSDEFFEGQEVTIVPHEVNKVVMLKIGKGKGAVDREIYHLGDGVQSLIMVTFFAFMSDSESLLFCVEEPEIYLHPGMQRRLIEVIIRNERLSRHQWIFTTHSNHFLDLTLDYRQISVFSFHKNPSGKKNVQRMSSPNSNVLAQLGVRASSVFRTNSIIWVEGVTDRKYLRIFLRKFLEKVESGKQLFEDIHFTFVELGGGNMVHFNFDGNDSAKINVKSIVDKSFLVIDGDNKSKANREQDFVQQLGDNIFIIKQKEIENLLPKSIFIDWINKKLKLSEAELEELNHSFDSSKLLSPEMKIGNFLNDQTSKIIREKKYSFASESGSIKDKVKFCEFACQELEKMEWSDFGHEIQDCVQNIANYIESQNS